MEVLLYYIVTLPNMGMGTGIFAPVHKITKATGLAGQSGTLPKRSSFRLSDVAGRKKDSPTSTLERNKASMSDIEVSFLLFVARLQGDIFPRPAQQGGPGGPWPTQ